jgi:DNA-binding CsgD family transcriptional regulator
VGRLIVGIELALVVVGLAIVSAGGRVALFVSLVPLAFVVAVPLVGALMVWRAGEILQAFRDAASGERLPGRAATSLKIWEFLERSVPLGGLLGFLLAAVTVFSGLPVLPSRSYAGLWRLAALFFLYAILFGTLFRVLHGAVRGLMGRPVRALDLSISLAFRKKYSLSDRECEVIGLVLQGRKYREIADQLFISIKTVKSHIEHVYDKTSARGRVDLIRLLQFDGSG